MCARPAAGAAAEAARDWAIKQNWGEYFPIVDGSIPGRDEVASARQRPSVAGDELPGI